MGIIITRAWVDRMISVFTLYLKQIESTGIRKQKKKKKSYEKTPRNVHIYENVVLCAFQKYFYCYYNLITEIIIDCKLKYKGNNFNKINGNNDKSYNLKVCVNSYCRTLINDLYSFSLLYTRPRILTICMWRFWRELKARFHYQSKQQQSNSLFMKCTAINICRPIHLIPLFHLCSVKEKC